MKLRSILLLPVSCFLLGFPGAGLMAQTSLSPRFVEEDLNAIIAGGGTVLGVGHRGDIFRSVDGGESFSIVLDGSVLDPLFAVATAGNTTIAAGRNGVIFRSVDDGENWLSASEFIFGDVTGVAGDGEGRWVAVGSGNLAPAVLVSDNDGETWSEIEPVGLDAAELHAVVWHDESGRFVAAGGDGSFEARILISADGETWERIEGLTSVPGELRFIETGHGGQLLAGGENGALIRSSGNEFNFEPVPGLVLSETLTAAVDLPLPGEWAVGGNAQLLLHVSADTGVSVLLEAAPPHNRVEGLAFVAPETLLVAGRFSGDPFEEPDPPAPEITAHPSDLSVFEGDDATFSISVTGANLTIEWRLSTDNGNTWESISGASGISFTEHGVTLSMDGNFYAAAVSSSSGNVTSEYAVSEYAILTVHEALAPEPGVFAERVAGAEVAGYLFLSNERFRRLNSAGDWVEGEWFYDRSAGANSEAILTLIDDETPTTPRVANLYLTFDSPTSIGYRLSEGGPRVDAELDFDFFGLPRAAGTTRRHSIWLGKFDDYYFDHEEKTGWIHHDEHGWLYVGGNGSPEGMWLWDHSQQDWLWTRYTVYPFFYSDSRQDWVYYDRGGMPNERTFHLYDSDEETWEEVEVE